MQSPLLVIEHGGDTMLPRIGILRALYPGAGGAAGAKAQAREEMPGRQRKGASGNVRCALNSGPKQDQAVGLSWARSGYSRKVNIL